MSHENGPRWEDAPEETGLPEGWKVDFSGIEDRDQVIRDIAWCVQDLMKRRPEVFSSKPTDAISESLTPAPENIPQPPKDPSLN